MLETYLQLFEYLCVHDNYLIYNYESTNARVYLQL